jgi:hypothetical protein
MRFYFQLEERYMANFYSTKILEGRNRTIDKRKALEGERKQ